MRFIATADWQLGMQAHYLSDEARARFRQDRFEAVRRLGELARQHSAEFIIVAGDVFETNQLERAVIARTFEALRAIPVPVVLLPGNHDPLDAASVYTSPSFEQAPSHVHVLRDSAPLEVIPNVEIVGAPWFTKTPNRDLLADAYAPLDETPPGSRRILVGHGAVSTLDPDRDNPSTIDVAALEAAMDSGRAHFTVLGDKHSATQVSARIWYPGTPEVTDRGEPNPGKALLVELTDDDASVEELAVGRWQFTTLRARIDSSADVATLKRDLDAFDDKARTALWLALEGTVSTATYAQLTDLLDAARDVFARVDHWKRHTDLAVVPDDTDFNELELSGYAREALDELVHLADTNDTAVDALGLLYRFTKELP